MDRHMNRMTMDGMKDSTLPTPVSTPSTTSACSHCATPAPESPPPMAAIPALTRSSNPSDIHEPMGPKVIQNTISMAKMNSGTASTGWVSTLSTRSDRDSWLGSVFLRTTALSSRRSM